MSIRRLERAALSTPYSLKAVVSLTLTGKAQIVSDFRNQFVPMVRYHNPKLSFGSSDSDDKPYMEITFSDATKHVLDLSKVVQSHALMERLLTIDADKHALKDKYVPVE